MKDIDKLSASLSDTIKDGNIKDVIIDISEASIDTIYTDDVLKEIPILSSFYKLYKAGLSIQDMLFTKKLLTILKNVQEVPIESRKMLIDKIENDSKYKTKVGEKLLFIIDKCEDTEKADLIGKLFKALLMDKLDYDDFLRASKCIELTHLEDLKNFIFDGWPRMDFGDAGDLVGSGLMIAKFEGEEPQHGQSGGRITCFPSPIGKKIYELLKI